MPKSHGHFQSMENNFSMTIAPYEVILMVAKQAGNVISPLVQQILE
ncbi:hypothetical protein [Rosenbergiella collisarenosi]|nr:hypothetical protein [Rosenbergiella collisarenosi]